MTIEEARKIIEKTDSPCLKRDMRNFIQRQKKRDTIKQKTARTTENVGNDPDLNSFSV